MCPAGRRNCQPWKHPAWPTTQAFIEKSVGREVSTTTGVVTLMSSLLKDKKIGKYIVPIVPDESRTFGMDPLFRQCGIYAHAGQLYEPVDSDQLLYYREAEDGQILEEGITEAGSMSSFIAAGTAYSAHGVPMIPMFIYYSMFGFQRIGDLIWAAGDMRARGFMLGGTAGRTTLNGEGLQHQDGNSHLIAIAYPTVRAYDPAFVYESTVIILDGMKRMFELGEDAIYYITIHNENYEMPPMPNGVEEGIIRGIYKLNTVEAAKTSGKRRHVQLFGSGAILRSVQQAQKILAEKFNVGSTAWSVTSYKELRKDAHACRHWNMLHPDQPPHKSYLEQADRRRGRTVHRGFRQRAGRGRASRSVGSGRLVCPGHRRFRPQRNPREPAPPFRSRRAVHRAGGFVSPGRDGADRAI